MSRRTYAPTWLIQASIALHLLAGLALCFAGTWVYALGAIVVNHLVLTMLGLWPKSQLLGENWGQLPSSAHAAQGCVAITIDDGPDPLVTPQVLALLKELKVQASFFCIGTQAEKHPELVRAIAQQGHAVENHSFSHPHHFSVQFPPQIDREIMRCQALITQLTGRAPRFFRAPAGLRNVFLDCVLQRHNLRLASWTHRGYDTRIQDADAVFTRLTRTVVEGNIFLLHDRNCALTRAGEPLILNVLPRLVAAIQAQGLRIIRMDQLLDDSVLAAAPCHT